MTAVARRARAAARRRGALGLALLAATAWLGGCRSPAAAPVATPIARELRLAPIVPDEADHAAADLAAAALGGDVAAALEADARIGALDAAREEAGEGPSGLAPAAADLVNATTRPGRGWRDAAAALLERDDLDPALRERLERAREGDPLEVADARVHDARMTVFAHAFNTVAQPIGQSLLSTALAPYRLGRAALRYGLHLYQADPLPLQRRQALAHWKAFLERYPEDPEAAEVSRRAIRAQEKWNETRRRDALREGERALDAGLPRQALIAAGRALRHAPEAEGDDARALIARATAAIDRERRGKASSLRFAPEAGFSAETRALAAALLAGPGPLLAADRSAPEWAASTLTYARAGALAQRGDERAARRALGEVADGDGERDPMVRHARAAIDDPRHNPWDTFVRARWRDRRQRAAWVLVGPWAGSRPRWSPTGVVEGLLDVPAIAQTIVVMPLRLVQWPWMPPVPTANVTAVQARRYLARWPRGVHAREVRDWLQDHEEDRENHVAALQVAEGREDPGDLGELRAKAARQALEVAEREERSDLRRALLMEVTRRFPGTEAGDEAGRLVREEALERTPQEIAITRGFLLENPEVAGVRGLALDPALLDDDPGNAELHPDGVALVGGRVVEIRTLAPDGDEDDPPDRHRVEIGDAQLARVVARLEETSFRNSLLDEDDAIQPDAERDLAFERARLGLADEIDPRPTAEARFTYRGMRERYGLVRRREPILPFDLVVRGSLSDLSLGAFPRMRAPKPTPDAILYE